MCVRVLFLTVFDIRYILASKTNWVVFHPFLCSRTVSIFYLTDKYCIIEDDKEENANQHRLFCLSNSATFVAKGQL